MINLYPSDGKARVWGKKGSAHDLNHTSLCVNMLKVHHALPWSCIGTSGTGWLIFIDAILLDYGSRMKSKVCINIFTATIKRNNTTIQLSQTLHQREKWKASDWPNQSPKYIYIAICFDTFWYTVCNQTQKRAGWNAIKEQMIINIRLSKHYSSMWRDEFFVKSAIILQQCRSSYCASLPLAITPHNDSISLFLQMLGLKWHAHRCNIFQPA